MNNMRTLVFVTGTTVRDCDLSSDHRPTAKVTDEASQRDLLEFCATYGPYVANDPASVLVYLRGATFLAGVWLAAYEEKGYRPKVYVYPETAGRELDAFLDGYRRAKGEDSAIPRLFGGDLNHPSLRTKRIATGRNTILTRIDEESYEDLVALGVAGARVAVEVLSNDRVDYQRFASDVAASLPAPMWVRDGREAVATLWAAGGTPSLQAPHATSFGDNRTSESDWMPPAYGRAACGVYLHEDANRLSYEEDTHLLNHPRHAHRAPGIRWPAAPPRLFIGVTHTLSARRKVFPFRWDAGIYVYLNKQDDAIEVDTKENRDRIYDLEAEFFSSFPGRPFMSLKQQEIGIDAGSSLAARYMVALQEVFGVDKAASAKRARRIIWGLK